jgi:hypothetical protein
LDSLCDTKLNSFFNMTLSSFVSTTSDQNRPVYWHNSASFVNPDLFKVEWNFCIKIFCLNKENSFFEISFSKSLSFREILIHKKLAELKFSGPFWSQVVWKSSLVKFFFFFLMIYLTTKESNDSHEWLYIQ